jgi:hypothetical protein
MRQLAIGLHVNNAVELLKRMLSDAVTHFVHPLRVSTEHVVSFRALIIVIIKNRKRRILVNFVFKAILIIILSCL